MSESFAEDVSLTGVKGYGEGAQVAKNPFGSAWGQAPQADEATFEDLWAKRQTAEATSAPGAGGAKVAASGQLSAGVGSFAKQFLGTPYVWGGSGPTGFDCSGFTQYVLKQFGISVPRVSYQQGQGGFAVGKDELQPGDLLFWDNSSRNNGADHVAIYIGDGKYIEAPRPGGQIQMRNLGSFGWARRYTSSSQPTEGRSRAA